jgi:hypothetical protein
MLNYIDFLLEKVVNESYLYYSPKVKNILNRIKDNNIASELIDSEGNNIKPDMTFIDLGKEGYLSFITMNNSKKILSSEYPSEEWVNNIDNVRLPNSYPGELYKHSNVFLKSRNEVGLGRFINKLFPGKFKSSQVEEFVNLFKASLEKIGEKFSIVEGKDIEFWYSSKNYKSITGTLGTSCMRSSRGIFELYIENPEVCKMLILTEEDKLLGRALIWKPEYIKDEKTNSNIESEYFLDRQYAINDSNIVKIKKWAIDKGFAYKTHNNHYSYKNITFKGADLNVKMEVQLKKLNYDYFPYLDTFRRFDPFKYILYNDDESIEGNYLLDSTSGDFTDTQRGHWSSYYDENIPENDAIYSYHLDTYIWLERSVQVTLGSSRYRGYYPDDYPDIIWSDFEGSYIHEDDVNYSDKYQDYILSINSVSIIYKINNNMIVNGDYYSVSEDDDDILGLNKLSKFYWYEKACEIDQSWVYGYIHSAIDKDLLTVNYKGELIPIEISIKVNSVSVENISTEVFLTKNDANILDIEFDENNTMIIDQFEYHLLLKDNNLIDALKNNLINKIKKVSEFISKNKSEDYEDLLDTYNKRLKEIENDKWF